MDIRMSEVAYILQFRIIQLFRKRGCNRVCDLFFLGESRWAKTYTALRHSQSEVRSENKAWIEVGPVRVTSATQITERKTKLEIETIT